MPGSVIACTKSTLSMALTSLVIIAEHKRGYFEKCLGYTLF